MCQQMYQQMCQQITLFTSTGSQMCAACNLSWPADNTRLTDGCACAITLLQMQIEAKLSCMRCLASCKGERFCDRQEKSHHKGCERRHQLRARPIKETGLGFRQSHFLPRRTLVLCAATLHKTKLDCAVSPNTWSE